MAEQKFKDDPNKLKSGPELVVGQKREGALADTEVDLNNAPEPCGDASDLLEQEAPQFAPGQKIGEHFELIALIGKGGLGAVYKARHLLLNTTVAIKFILPSNEFDVKTLMRFKREAQACAKMKHPNIAGVYDFGIHDDRPYIVMEYVEGTPLNEIIETFGALEPERTLHILKQAADALSHAHGMNVVHRDVKPHNIMICNTDDGETIKLIDFGLARSIESDGTDNLTGSGEVFGTPSYMSPEQCKGLATDARADIYSLGCVAYEMLSGEPPFSADSPVQVLIKHMSEQPKPLHLGPDQRLAGLGIVVDRAILKDPNSRYQTAKDMLNDLELIDQGRKPKASVSLAAAKLQQLFNKRKWTGLWLLLAASLIVPFCMYIAPSVLQYQNQTTFDSLTQKINQYPDSLANQPNYLARARIYYDKGDYKAAVSDISDAARVGPLDSRAYSFQADCLEKAARFSESAHAASQAIALDNNNAEAYYLRSVAESDLLQYDDAVRDATAAIERSNRAGADRSSAFNALVARARAYNQLRRFDESLKDLNLALTFMPHGGADKKQAAQCFTFKAGAENALHQLPEAQKDLSVAMQLNPASAQSYLISACVHANLNQYDKAQEDLDQALLLDPAIEKDTMAMSLKKRLATHH